MIRSTGSVPKTRGIKPISHVRSALAGLTILSTLSGAACSSAPARGVARTTAPVLTASEPEPIQAGRAPTPREYSQAPDVTHYDIEIALGPTGGPIAARAQVDFVPPAQATAVALDFTGLAVHSVELDGESASFELADGKISVELPQPGPRPRRLDIHYSGTPDDGLIQQENVHGQPTVFADNWPNRARFWFPAVDHPSDKATIRFTVHAPSTWSVIANGVLQGNPGATSSDGLDGLGYRGTHDHRTWVWSTDVAISSYMMVIGAGPMVIGSGGSAACGTAPASPRADGCIDVGYWVFAPDAASAARSFRRSDQMIDFFTELIGPFPYEKLMNVQSSTRFGGMENASAIFYSERAIANGSDIEGTVSHEIAHQWFGDSVTETEWSHLWLSEGFATYFGALFFEHADGVVDFRNRLEQNRQSYVNSGVVGEPVLSQNPDLFALLNANNYPKGGWVLHMLRGILGDDTFFEGIRAYYAAFAGGNALTEDFVTTMEGVSGRDLGWFFDQWLRRPGYPMFSLEWGYDAGTEEVWYRIDQTQDPNWPTFRTPLELVAEASGAEVRHSIDVDARTVEGRFAVSSAPSTLQLDPDGWVLKDVTVTRR